MLLQAQASPADTEEAILLLGLAAIHDIPEAYLRLGEICLEQKQFNAARLYFEEAVELGCVTAWSALGTLYFEGWGVEQDFSKAYSCYTTGIDHYNSSATVNLGILLHTGLGIPKPFFGPSKNEKQAMRCFEKVSQAEQIAAWNRLGMMYLFDSNAGKNYVAARNCFTKLNSLTTSRSSMLGSFGLGITSLIESRSNRTVKSEKVNEARAHCNKALVFSGSEAALYLSGYLDRDHDKKDHAVRNSKAVEEWYYLGRLFTLPDFFNEQQKAENAKNCFRVVASAGDGRGYLELGKICQQTGHVGDAFQAYKKAAMTGGAEAYYRLGLLLGLPAIGRNHKKSMIAELNESGLIAYLAENYKDGDFLEIKKVLLGKSGRCGYTPALHELEKLTLFDDIGDWVHVNRHAVKTATNQGATRCSILSQSQ